LANLRLDPETRQIGVRLFGADLTLADRRWRSEGRPTKLTEERESDLAFLLAAGVPIGVAARSVGVSERSVERWMKDGLRERVAEAKARSREQIDAASEARLVVLISLAARENCPLVAVVCCPRCCPGWGKGATLQVGSIPAARPISACAEGACRNVKFREAERTSRASRPVVARESAPELEPSCSSRTRQDT
jgi:hypothetical protein